MPLTASWSRRPRLVCRPDGGRHLRLRVCPRRSPLLCVSLCLYHIRASPRLRTGSVHRSRQHAFCPAPGPDVCAAAAAAAAANSVGVASWGGTASNAVVATVTAEVGGRCCESCVHCGLLTVLATGQAVLGMTDLGAWLRIPPGNLALQHQLHSVGPCNCWPAGARFVATLPDTGANPAAHEATLVQVQSMLGQVRIASCFEFDAVLSMLCCQFDRGLQTCGKHMCSVQPMPTLSP